MIVERHGDLLGSGAQALVNPVNCAGAMGKGLAAAFKTQYPAMHAEYVLRCEDGLVRPGVPYAFVDETGAPVIINFPTKQHWKGRSRLIWIEAGLCDLPALIDELDLTSIALPRLGCGLGGLDWADVRPLIEQELGELPITVEVWTPAPTSAVDASPTLF